MRTSKEWMGEDTSQFLKWKSYQSTGAKAVLARFGARPVSGGPNQPVDAADVRRRAVLWGASNEFAVCTAACVRLRWFAADGARFAAQAQQTRPVATSSSEHEERRRCDPDRYKSILFRSIFRFRSPPLTGGPRARHRRREKGFQWRVVPSTL